MIFPTDDVSCCELYPYHGPAMAHIILKSFLLREVLNKQGVHLLRGDERPGSRLRPRALAFKGTCNDGHCSNYDRLSSFCDSLNQSCTI